MSEKLETGFVRDEIYNESRVDLLHPNAMVFIAETDYERLVWKYVAAKLKQEPDAWTYLERACLSFINSEGRSYSLLTLGKICDEGLKKYGPWNWYKGCKNSAWLNHALIHLYNREGLKFLWNIMALLDQELRISNGELPAEFDDIKVPD
jgi:hypothetical protein